MLNAIAGLCGAVLLAACVTGHTADAAPAAYDAQLAARIGADERGMKPL